VASIQPITSDEAAQAMIDGLTGRIRDELRKRIMERIEPDINSAIDAALDAMKVAIESRYRMELDQTLVKVLVERR
jgi:hypothetical protein